jgi:hypothetical protein
MLYIAQSELKNYCTKRSHSYVDLVAFYSTNNKDFTGIVSKRLGVGTGIVTSPVKVLSFFLPSGELSSLLGG